MSVKTKIIGTCLVLLNCAFAQGGIWDEVETASSSVLPSSSSVKVSSLSLSSSSVLPSSSSVLQSSSINLSSGIQVLSSSSMANSSVNSISSSTVQRIRRPFEGSNGSPPSLHPNLNPESLVSSSSFSSSSSSLSKSSQASKLSIDTLARQQIETPSLADQRALLGKIKVTDIPDFQDYRDYRSPRKAAFMSLLLPGMGQAYVGGVSNWVRGLVYAGIEGALWTYWYQYSIVGADNYSKKADALRRSAWSDSLYESRIYQSYQALAGDPTSKSNFNTRYDSQRLAWCTAVFGQGQTNYSQCLNPSNSGQNSDFASEIATFSAQAAGTDFPYDDPATHNSLIESNDFAWGWRDSPTQSLASLNLSGGNRIALAEGSDQSLYRQYRAEMKNRQAATGKIMGYIALNHIVSALDAAFSAYHNNQSLYKDTPEPRVSFSAPMMWNGTSWQTSLQVAWGF